MARRDHVRSVALVVLPLGLLVYPLAGLAAYVAFVATSSIQRRWPIPIPTAVLAASLVLSTVASERPADAWAGTAGALVAGVLLVTWSMRVARKDVRFVALGFAAGGIALAAKAVLDVFAFGSIRASGFQFHPNILGASAMLALFGILAGRGGVRTRIEQVLMAAGVFGTAGAVVLSGSRGALLGLVVGLPTFGLIRRPRAPRTLRWSVLGTLMVIASTVAVLTVLFTSAGDALPWIRRVAQLDGLGDDRGRIETWFLALEMARTSPLLGHGFGAWGALVTAAEPTLDLAILPNSHDLYLELLLDTGALGLVAFLTWIGSLGAAMWRAGRAGSGVAAAAALGALAGALAHNVTDVLLYQTYITGALWVVIGVGLAGGPEADPGSPAAPRTARRMTHDFGRRKAGEGRGDVNGGHSPKASEPGTSGLPRAPNPEPQ